MTPPRPLTELRQHVEQVQTIEDPEERIRALGAVQQGMTDLLGVVGTYAKDAQLEQEARAASHSNGAGPQADTTTDDTPPEPTDAAA